MGGACHKKHGPRLECGLGDRYQARVIFHVWLAWTLMLRTPGARMNSGSSAFAPRATPPPLRASSNMAGAGPQICFVGKVDGWVAERRILDTDSDTDTVQIQSARRRSPMMMPTQRIWSSQLLFWSVLLLHNETYNHYVEKIHGDAARM